MKEYVPTEHDEKLDLIRCSIVDFFNDFEVKMSERMAILEVIKYDMLVESRVETIK